MVKAQRFDPDCTRSGRFVGSSQAHASAVGNAEHTGEMKAVSEADDVTSVGGSEQTLDGGGERLAGDTDDTNTDSSSDAGSFHADEIDDSTTLAELWDMVRPSLRPKLVTVSPLLSKFVHKLSLVVHLKPEGSSRFLCGRLASARYEHHLSCTSVECPRCTTCFQNKEANMASS